MSSLGSQTHHRSTDSLLSFGSHDNTSLLSYVSCSETSSSIRQGSSLDADVDVDVDVDVNVNISVNVNMNANIAKVIKSSPWLRKPVWVVRNASSSTQSSSTHTTLERHLSLFDLICIGVGATIGSGIFVLCGLIAHDYAGPATFISWGIAGISACASGICYAELSGKFPVAGSSYSYVVSSACRSARLVLCYISESIDILNLCVIGNNNQYVPNIFST